MTTEIVQLRVSRAFAAAFARVHAAFGTSPEEIEEAKAIVRAHPVQAEDSYYTSAAMLEAGWKPLKEQAAAFLKRTGFVPPQRWNPEQAESVEVQWPSRDLRRAA